MEIDWFNDDKFNNFVFRTYSDKKVDLKVEDADDHPNMLLKMLKSCAVQKSERQDYTEHGHPDVFRCASVTDSKCEYGFLYYENNSSTATLKEYVQFTKFDNLEIMHPYEGTDFYIEVFPNSSELVILKRTKRACQFTCQYFTNFILPEDQQKEKIKKEGKKTQIRRKDENTGDWVYYEIYFYCLNDGSGY